VVEEEWVRDTVPDILPDWVPLPQYVGMGVLEEDWVEDRVQDSLAVLHSVGKVKPLGVRKGVELAQRVGEPEAVVEPLTLGDKVRVPLLHGVGLVVEDTERVLVSEAVTLGVAHEEKVWEGVRAGDTLGEVLSVGLSDAVGPGL
jgi:hypothetical protein